MNAPYLALEKDIAEEAQVTEIFNAALERLVLPQIPMGKLLQPEDIVHTILFLASEQAWMVTGQVIKVSGGHAL